jgi:mRNA deadenylase 3'-5' endonuclease subunit Ccr4
MSFKISSFNILADCYVKINRNFNRKKFYHPQTIDSNNRKVLTRLIIESINSDVWCLQEVDNEKYYKEIFKENGYDYIWVKRPNDKKDGLMVCWKRDKFRRIDEHVVVDFNELTNTVGLPYSDKIRLVKNCIGILVYLEVLEENYDGKNGINANSQNEVNVNDDNGINANSQNEVNANDENGIKGNNRNEVNVDNQNEVNVNNQNEINTKDDDSVNNQDDSKDGNDGNDKDSVNVNDKLKQSKKNILAIANTHVFYNPNFSDIKLKQTTVLMWRIYFEIELMKKRLKNYNFSPIICGDFNSVPTSCVYELIHKKKYVYEALNYSKILLDNDMKKIARTLRSAGIDAQLYGKTHKKVTDVNGNKRFCYNDFFLQAWEERRILITRSKRLVERSRCPPFYVVKTPGKTVEVLAEMIEHCNYELKTSESRCSDCNGMYISITREQAEKATYVPPNKYDYSKVDFLQCTTCTGVFWWTKNSLAAYKSLFDAANEKVKLSQKAIEEKINEISQYELEGDLIEYCVDATKKLLNEEGSHKEQAEKFNTFIMFHINHHMMSGYFHHPLDVCSSYKDYLTLDENSDVKLDNFYEEYFEKAQKLLIRSSKGESALDEGKNKLDEEGKLSKGKDKLSEGIDRVSKKQNKLGKGKDKSSKGKDRLSKKQNKLSKGKDRLSKKQNTLSNGKDSGIDKLSKGKDKLDKGQDRQKDKLTKYKHKDRVNKDKQKKDHDKLDKFKMESTKAKSEEENKEAQKTNEPLFTNLTKTYQGTLDYVLYNKNDLQVLSLEKLPSNTEKYFPSFTWPSDHLLISVKFKLKK